MDNLSVNEMISFIEKNRVFSALTRDEILEILPLFENVKVPAGTVLFKQGDVSDSLYLLIKGELISVLTKPSGNTMVVGSVNPVETVGELGVISDEPRSLSVEAVIESELLKLSAKNFLEICSKKPAILTDIFQFVVRRSLKTIQLISTEKASHHISIVFPISKDLSHEKLKETFESQLQNRPVTFICADDMPMGEFKKTIEQHVVKQPVIIFLNHWNDELIKFCVDKITHIYLLGSDVETDVIELDKEIKEIIAYFDRLLNVRLELVLFHPEKTQKIVNTAKWLKIAKFDLHHHVRFQNEDDIKRLMRFMTGKAIALVLGGGGARGLMHLGVIKALLEKGYPIDAIGGTSIGSSIGACYASTLDYEKTVEMTDLLKNVTPQTISVRNLTWPIISLFSSNPATQVLMDIFGEIRIEDLLIPYFSISSNLSEHKEKVHREGFIWEAIRSSVALPGIFPPVVHDNEVLFDGGLLNNLPVDAMRRLIGPDHIIIASSLSRKDKVHEEYFFPPVLTLKQAIFSKFGLGFKNYRYPPFFETFLDALLLGSSFNEARNCAAADILIKPNLSGFKMLSIMKEKEKQIIDIGYQAAFDGLNQYSIEHPDFQESR